MITVDTAREAIDDVVHAQLKALGLELAKMVMGAVLADVESLLDKPDLKERLTELISEHRATVDEAVKELGGGV